MASKLFQIIEYLSLLEPEILAYVGHDSKDEGTFINKYNGSNTDCTGKVLSLQLMVKRFGKNNIYAYEKAETDARYILRKIKEKFTVVNDKEIPLGKENNSYVYIINFDTYEEV